MTGLRYKYGVSRLNLRVISFNLAHVTNRSYPFSTTLVERQALQGPHPCKQPCNGLVIHYKGKPLLQGLLQTSSLLCVSAGQDPRIKVTRDMLPGDDDLIDS